MAVKTKTNSDIIKAVAPKFRDTSTMTIEQLTNPDYRLDQLMKENGQHPAICSKCHHCR